MTKLNALVRLHPGYGLGDGVRMSIVLQHLAKYRRNWIVDYQTEEGVHQVGRGIVANHFAYGTPYPHDHYDFEVQAKLYDTFANFHDRPNTCAVSCLHDQFGIDWDATCGRYVVHIRQESMRAATSMLGPLRCGGKRLVVIHYQGDSAPERKNLTDAQAEAVCKAIEALDCVSLLLDWRHKSQLSQSYRTIGRSPMAKTWGRDAEMNCAVIAQCDAFVGIDSGPGKCASATNTPTLIVWTGHNPIAFHDLAPNTTHLVPDAYEGLFPVVNDVTTVTWFEAHCNVRYYEHDPVEEIRKWLKGTLSKS